MLSEKLETALMQAELQSNAVAAALGTGEPVALEHASSMLRELALVFSGLAQDIAPPDRSNVQFITRLKRLASATAAQRASLIRCSVAVERALGILMPAATEAATYAATSGPYGSRGRQTGAFKLLAA
jgi:hypothetical protein